jgi:Pvc16 N-terminal domain
MIAHALKIIQSELREHLLVYSPIDDDGNVILSNLSDGLAGSGGGTVERDRVVLNIVNIKEEKTLKNLPNYVKNDITLRASYENPPVFLNFMILFCATHSSYEKAILYLSRTIRFFQHKNVFTQDNVAPSILNAVSHKNLLDELETFKLVLDLYSPSMEEVNHLWGTLGGKQYPFVLYMMRMLDLKYKAIQSESGLITEVVTEFKHKKILAN